MDDERRTGQPDDAESREAEARRPGGTYLTLGIAIGLGIGAAIGLGSDNIGLGIGVGLPIGVAIGFGLEASQRRNPEE